MKSLVQLQSEIHTLQQQAAELRTREFDRTIAEIVEQMAAFGITLAHLKAALKQAPAGAARGRKARGPGKGTVKRKPGRPKGKAAKSPAKAKADRKVKGKGKGHGNGKATKAGTRKPAAIKYRGPTGEAWSGRGKTPTWLRALVEAGRKVEDFKV